MFRKFLTLVCMALLFTAGCSNIKTDKQSAAKTEDQPAPKPATQLTVISSADGGMVLLRAGRFR